MKKSLRLLIGWLIIMIALSGVGVIWYFMWYTPLALQIIKSILKVFSFIIVCFIGFGIVLYGAYFMSDTKTKRSLWNNP